MSLVLSMSLAGSLMIVIHFIILFFIKDRAGFHWQMICLKIALFFYMVPLEACKYLLPNGILQILNTFNIASIASWKFTRAVSIPLPGGRYLIFEGLTIGMFSIWLVIAFAYIFYHLIQYRYIRNKLFKTSYQIGEEEASAALQKFPELKKIYRRRHVRIFRNPEVQGPFTAGFFTPCIILPDLEYEQQYSRDIYGHELYHIKNRDILLKFLALVAIGIHWYNPFSYLLLFQLDRISEHYCDECVIRNMGPEKRVEYAKLLIYIGSHMETSSMILSSGITAESKKIKKRVLFIKNYEKKENPKCLWGVLIIAVTGIFFASLFCYKQTPGLLQEQQNEKGIFSQGENSGFTSLDMVFMEDNEPNTTSGWVWGMNYQVQLEELPMDRYNGMFIKQSGEPFFYDSIFESKRCRHVYRPGVYCIHEKNKNNSCQLIFYSSERCESCKKVWIKTPNYSAITEKCQHIASSEKRGTSYE